MSETANFKIDFAADELLTQIEQRLPVSTSDPRILVDAEKKLHRLRAWLDEQKLDAALISRRDNFAWLTVGGDNHVLKNTEVGAGHLLVTMDKQYLLTYTMDGERILEEQIPGQGYKLEMLPWYEGDPRQMALSLGGKRIAADTPVSGTEERALEINRIHEPLTDLEIDRIRWLARQTGILLETVSKLARPGMSEEEISRQIHAIFALKGIGLEVLLVGSDERVERLRHSQPTDKRLEQYLMMHTAAHRWGLHANVSRCINFGEPKEQIRKAYLAAVTIEALVLNMLQPGVPFSEILRYQKDWYKEQGFPGEWKNHFQGGPAGYMIADPTRCLTKMCVEVNQAYDWFITLPGVMVEELTLLTDCGIEVASLGNDWPVISISAGQSEVLVPDIMVV